MEQKGTQFRRTDGAIVQASIRLLQQKSFEEITIQDILDETPVSKGTFYAHFPDKYAVAERMLSLYRQEEDTLRRQMAEQGETKYGEIARQAYTRNRELVAALLKIHTETVDLKMNIREDYRRQYLAECGAGAGLEASVYADAMTAYQTWFMTEGRPVPQNTADSINSVMIQVFLHILKQDENEALRRRIQAAVQK